MAKAPKKYTGDVQFDVWGNLVDYQYQGKVELTADNFDNGQIVLPIWDSTLRSQVMKPVFYTATELDLVIYPTPQTRYGRIYVGECNRYFTVPNFEFQDTIEYDDYGSSTYSKFFVMKSQITGRSYRVFLKDLKDFIKIMDKGVVTGMFTFCKRNNKFGLKPV